MRPNQSRAKRLRMEYNLTSMRGTRRDRFTTSCGRQAKYILSEETREQASDGKTQRDSRDYFEPFER